MLGSTVMLGLVAVVALAGFITLVVAAPKAISSFFVTLEKVKQEKLKTKIMEEELLNRQLNVDDSPKPKYRPSKETS